MGGKNSHNSHTYFLYNLLYINTYILLTKTHKNTIFNGKNVWELKSHKVLQTPTKEQEVSMTVIFILGALFGAVLACIAFALIDIFGGGK